MSLDVLTFGTDGWRDIIGDRFTVDNVARASQAYARHILDQGYDSAVIGYDTRFNGDMFAYKAARVMTANGLSVELSTEYLPTPALSFAVKHLKVGGGVMLTASHNPPPYLGFKLKGRYGGTATEDIYQDVSDRIPDIGVQNIARYNEDRHTMFGFDIRKKYFEAISQLVDLDVLRSREVTIAHDGMGGGASGWLSDFFQRYAPNVTVKEIRCKADPLFYGVNPEPIDKNLALTMEAVKDMDVLFATATDGDGDRLGVVLPDGSFFNSHQIFAVLLHHLHQKGMMGRVVKTFTVSRMIERLAVLRGLQVTETAVGFKYIVDAMLKGNVLIGGEESGGIGVKGHIPERDGIANSILLLEAVLSSQKSLAELFSDLEDEVHWKHSYDRIDLHLDGNELKDDVMDAVSQDINSFAERKVLSREYRDGVKFNLEGKAWLLFRPSGTEPVLRIYCEAQSDDEVASILKAADVYVQSLSA